jgi:hypothetical protein
MASLRDLLGRTMLFTAARDAGIDLFARKQAPGDPITLPVPVSAPSTPPADRAVWSWTHDPSSPSKFTNVKALVQAHGHSMAVFDKVEVESVKVKLDGNEVNLPLRTSFVLAKYSLASAKLKNRSEGWWQLEANVDASMLVVFGYELVPASGADPKPLDMLVIEGLKDKFFPDPDVPAGDPDRAGQSAGADASVHPIVAEIGQSITAFVAPPWVIVVVSLTTCKERADFEPGGILGAGRIYPHVMVACNHKLDSSEAKIVLQRPAKVPTHSDESLPDVRALFVADTNESHATVNLGSFGLFPSFPLWSNFFDYYDLNPPIGQEFLFVDPSKNKERRVSEKIQREAAVRFLGGDVYEKTTTFLKLPAQGAFDNVHLAPRMKFENPTTGLKIAEVSMAPFCEHDCLHTHMRWGKPAKQLVGSAPKSTLGFLGRMPHAGEARPLVPANQSVFITLLTPSAMRYRAVAAGPLPAGSWSVFNHHGSAYSLSIASPSLFGGARMGVAAAVIHNSEPYTRSLGIIAPFLDREIIDVDPLKSLAALYYRLQFTGTTNPDFFTPRIKILNLDGCRQA